MPRTITCPYCGARFEVPETVTIAVCPYCGTTVWASTGEVFREHYMFDVRIEYNRAFDNVRMLAQRQFAAPDDIYERASPEAGRLHFIPLYLYHVSVRAECPGNPEAGLEEEYAALVATRRLPEGLDEEYRFAVRGRKFFEPAKIERGIYYQPDLDAKELLPKATERARMKALREASEECDNPKLVDESKWLGIVHYPFWEVIYKYEERRFRGIVDATDGTVVYLEYPIGGRERGVLLAMSAGLLLLSALIGAAIGSAVGSTIYGGAGGLVAGIAGSIPSFRLGAARVGRYRLRSRLERNG